MSIADNAMVLQKRGKWSEGNDAEDAADRLMRALYGGSLLRKLVGGADAPVLDDAAREIADLRTALARYAVVMEKSAAGGHVYRCQMCHRIMPIMDGDPGRMDWDRHAGSCLLSLERLCDRE